MVFAFDSTSVATAAVRVPLAELVRGLELEE